jgi:hypothetical protein
LIATSLQCRFCVFMTSEPNTTSVGLYQSSMSSQQGPGLSNIMIQPHQTLHLLDFLVHQSRMWSQQGPMPLPQNLTWSPQVHHHTKIVPHITAEIYCPWHKPALIDNKIWQSTSQLVWFSWKSLTLERTSYADKAFIHKQTYCASYDQI